MRKVISLMQPVLRKIKRTLVPPLSRPAAEQINQPLVQTAYDPELIPPPSLMGTEGIMVMEEWFRWAEEWSFLLRNYGKITQRSNVMEIGCGLGRIAYPLRFILFNGTYNGFEIVKDKVNFLQNHFTPSFPNFNFYWANIHNTYYNPTGDIHANEYRFPYDNNSFDVVFAASVFTHTLPDIAENYFRETARVLKQNGRAVFSFFILDNYRKGQARQFGFARAGFNFDYSYAYYGEEFKTSNPGNPEEMTAYKRSLLERFVCQAGLEFDMEPLPGLWSDSFEWTVAAQDIIVLRKPN
jgi:SAM-dependent methyltransferase